MTPVDEMSAGDFICIFEFRFGRRGYNSKKHEYKIQKHSPVLRIRNGNKSISSAFDISRNTVRRYVRMYQDSGIPAEKLPSLSDARLQELFAIPGARERQPSERQIRLEALLPEYAARLSRRGMTVKKLYEEYRAVHPDGYLKASFGMKLRQFMLQTNAIGHVEHRAGDQMYIDFAGNRLEIVDEATAEARKVEVFVAILPCSHYTYCEAVWSQKKEDLIKACENAIHFMEGLRVRLCRTT